MNLETTLRARRDEGHKLLVPYVTGGLGRGWLAREAGRSVPTGSTVLVTLSGRGDKDAMQVAERLTGEPLE